MLASRFGYVVEHMCSRLLTAAFSPILRDFYDFAATITGPPERGWPTPAMSASILLFTGTMTESVRNTIEEYGVARLEPGDVIIANDPYRNGTHVNDILFTRPVFHDGRLISFVNMKAHQLDMGGIVPGGFSLAKHNVYENGLVLSPRALFRAGRPVHDTWSLIFDNVRFGEILAPDMLTAVAELELGERMILESVERYGVASVLGAMTYVTDASAERIAVALRALPDGEWVGEDAADADAVADDEEYRVRVRIVKRGARAEVDFSGTSRQARSAMNATPLDAKTSVGIAFKSILDPMGWFTSGTIRPIDIVLPEGTVISALPPDGAVFAYWEQNQVILSAMLRALGQAVGETALAGDHGCADIHNANGVLADGTPWISAAQVGGEIGAYGANRHGDADSQMLSYQANGIGVRGRGGRGGRPGRRPAPRDRPRHRGAGPPPRRRVDAARLAVAARRPASPDVAALQAAPGFGAHGGGSGATGGIWIFDGAGRTPALSRSGPGSYADATPVGGVLDPQTLEPSREGVYHYPFRVPFWETRPDAVLRYVNCAGGGWGDPLERDPDAVRRDVRDGYVTIEGAARDYGVVITGDPDLDPEGLVLDAQATSELRASRR